MVLEAVQIKQKREEEDQKKAGESSSAAAKSSAKEEIAPDDLPTISLNEMGKLTQIAAAKAGDKWKGVEVERDTLKKQVVTLNSQVGDHQVENESLLKQVDDLSSNDPARKDLTKREKQVRDERRQLGTDQESLKTGQEELRVGREEVEAMNREATIISIADDLGALDEVDQISRLCSTLGATSDEQIKEVISTVFKANSGETSIHSDSGKSRGSNTYFTRAQIKDRAFWLTNKEAILEAEADGRIRD